MVACGQDAVDVNKTVKEKVKAKAKAFLESGNFVELVMRPEGE